VTSLVAACAALVFCLCTCFGACRCWLLPKLRRVNHKLEKRYAADASKEFTPAVLTMSTFGDEGSTSNRRRKDKGAPAARTDDGQAGLALSDAGSAPARARTAAGDADAVGGAPLLTGRLRTSHSQRSIVPYVQADVPVATGAITRTRTTDDDAQGAAVTGSIAGNTTSTPVAAPEAAPVAAPVTTAVVAPPAAALDPQPPLAAPLTPAAAANYGMDNYDDDTSSPVTRRAEAPAARTPPTPPLAVSDQATHNEPVRGAAGGTVLGGRQKRAPSSLPPIPAPTSCAADDTPDVQAVDATSSGQARMADTALDDEPRPKVLPSPRREAPVREAPVREAPQRDDEPRPRMLPSPRREAPVAPASRRTKLAPIGAPRSARPTRDGVK
jgi:hypothetical protein